MLFLNTLVNSAPTLEERVEIRADLMYTGLLEGIEQLKALTSDEAVGTSELSDEHYELDPGIRQGQEPEREETPHGRKGEQAEGGGRREEEEDVDDEEGP